MDSLSAGLAGEDLTPAAVERLVGYARLLATWNGTVNLVADAGEAALLEHLVDCLGFREALCREGGSMADVGTGAGLPGLVLGIAEPSWEVVLVESVARKCDFLREAVQSLGLSNVQVIEDRVENVGRDAACRERFDRVIARRLAPLAILLEFLLPLARLGGAVVMPKGVGLDDELAEAAGVAELLGGAAPEVRSGPRGRRLVWVAKTAPTAERYPRRVGVPRKRPLRALET